MPTSTNCVSRSAELLLVYLLAATPVLAALNINTDTVQKAVVFLYGADEAGKVDLRKELGTGFFIRVPLTSDAKQSYVLLITARHIFDPQGCVYFATTDQRRGG